ncbi:polysaccharide pyruvyl transferase family protein [Aquimarina sp. 2-A2]|uniref:polysaccharide pyruvyl transferase family protein n=1 Tax=Aquimarina sp. 2-A2 TaxID=3382644 RepID=UPI00387F1861
MKSLKICIKGAYGEANFGDDLLMLVLENYFLKEFDDVHLNFIGEQSLYPKSLLKKSEYREQLKRYDWLVYGGGTQFFAFKESESYSLLKKISMVLKKPQLLLDKLYNEKIEKRVDKISFLGFGLGPFHNNQGMIRKAKSRLIDASFIGVRDEISFNYCNDWGLTSFLGADIVFSKYFKLPQLKTKMAKSKKRIGIIVRDWNWNERGTIYTDKLKQIYSQYSDSEDIELDFIIFSSVKDKNTFKSLKSENPVVWDPSESTVDQFISKLNDYDAFITARYHGAILGVLLRKPVICVEIEPKLKILTKQLSELQLWAQPFEIESLIDHINNLNYNVEYKDIDVFVDRANNMLAEFTKALK